MHFQLFKPPLRLLPRNYLDKLIELIDEENQEHNKLYTQLFYSRYSKPDYTFEDYWEVLLSKDEKIISYSKELKSFFLHLFCLSIISKT